MRKETFDALIVDVDRDSMAESMSIETEYGCRLTLRVPGQQRNDAPTCATPGAPRTVQGQMPEALRNIRLR